MSKAFSKRLVGLLTVGLLAGPVTPAATAAFGVEPAVAAVPTATAAADVSERISGATRYETAVAVSQHLHPTGAGVVFVANGTDFPDALAGGPGASLEGGPVLLVRGTSSATPVPPEVRDELSRLDPDRIVVLGGEAVVSAGTVTTLRAYAPVTRLAGENRFGTAAAVAGLWDTADTVYLASGDSYPDALAGGAAAAHQDAPVLLSRTTSLPRETVARLEALQPSRVVVLGGTAVVSPSVVDEVREAVPQATVTRYAGANRYETAAVVAARVWPGGSDDAFFTTGEAFADALAGVPAAAQYGAPMLLVRPTCAPDAIRDVVTDLGVSTEYVLGGVMAVADGATATSCTTGPAEGTVLAVLEDIPVKGRAPKTGYSRDQFGPEWTDAVDVQGGRNGCDTRNDVLRRDLTGKTFRSGSNGCVVETGTLQDPFSGTTMAFVLGETSRDIHIDHLVALGDAWQKGAQQITATERRHLANDPLNLWAVSGSLNSQKGDGDAATWLPPNRAIRCDYVSYQVAVKDKYNLWMTQAEKDAISSIVTNSCPTKVVPTAHDVPPLGR